MYANEPQTEQCEERETKNNGECHHPTSAVSIDQGSHLREKTAFFTQKKSRLRKSENAVPLLYAKNSDLTHQNAFSLFVFAPSTEGL